MGFGTKGKYSLYLRYPKYTQDSHRLEKYLNLEGFFENNICLEKYWKITQKPWKVLEFQGSKIALVRSYLRVPKAAGQVKILKFLVKIKFYPYMLIIFVMQGKCPFSDISRPEFYYFL